MTISSPILRSIDSTQRYLCVFLIFPSAIKTLMLSQTLRLMVFFSFSSKALSSDFYLTLLQKSVKTLSDIYPQVNRFYERYSPYKSSRMCELIQARPFLEAFPFPDYYSEPFQALLAVVCRWLVVRGLPFLGVVSLFGVFEGYFYQGRRCGVCQDYYIFTGLCSSMGQFFTKMIACSLALLLSWLLLPQESPAAGFSSYCFFAYRSVIAVPPSRPKANRKQSHSDISLVYWIQQRNLNGVFLNADGFIAIILIYVDIEYNFEPKQYDLRQNCENLPSIKREEKSHGKMHSDHIDHYRTNYSLNMLKFILNMLN